MKTLKDRINSAITTMRSWPNVVKVDGELYGIYFIKKNIMYLIGKSL